MDRAFSGRESGRRRSSDDPETSRTLPTRSPNGALHQRLCRTTSAISRQKTDISVSEEKDMQGGIPVGEGNSVQTLKGSTGSSTITTKY
jgi:hypothetical protein